jgi:hypothetical protein
LGKGNEELGGGWLPEALMLLFTSIPLLLLLLPPPPTDRLAEDPPPPPPPPPPSPLAMLGHSSRLFPSTITLP